MRDMTNELLNEVSAAQFAMYECALYLDTHKHDKKALEKFNAYKIKYKKAVERYEAEYGPLTLCGEFCGGGYDWTDAPWPWLKEAN